MHFSYTYHFYNSQQINTRITKVIKMTNLQFSIEILNIYNSVFLKALIIFSKNKNYCIIHFFLFLRKKKFFCDKSYVLIVDSSNVKVQFNTIVILLIKLS